MIDPADMFDLQIKRLKHEEWRKGIRLLSRDLIAEHYTYPAIPTTRTIKDRKQNKKLELSRKGNSYNTVPRKTSINNFLPGKDHTQ